MVSSLHRLSKSSKGLVIVFNDESAVVVADIKNNRGSCRRRTGVGRSRAHSLGIVLFLSDSAALNFKFISEELHFNHRWTLRRAVFASMMNCKQSRLLAHYSGTRNLSM
jgi:hypothetical protein